MRQIRDLSDERNHYHCVHCGRVTDSKDHIPSKIFLDEPYSENLPVVRACRACNTGFSLDEEYVACAIDCAKAGTVDKDKIARPKIKNVLSKKDKLRYALEKSIVSDSSDHTVFHMNSERLLKVVLKLARGHALYELGIPHFETPIHSAYQLLSEMNDSLRIRYESLPELDIFPEVGSRVMERLLSIDNSVFPDWIIVQEGQYRYCVYQAGLDVVRFIISEYLACEVAWE
jgi:hypothetical protein